MSITTPLRVGTRGSPMAVVQAGLVADMITARTGRPAELVRVTTFGDVSRAELTQIGGTGVFVSGLRARLLAGEVDVAVHSLKDLPTAAASGIALAAVPTRDDPRDALVTANGAKLSDLPAGARIGTGAPRRAAQVKLLRPDVTPVPVRGNAGTRLGKVGSGQLDAVLLGYAGLARIGRLDAVTQIFEPDEMLPAPGQGALAVECLAGAGELGELLATIDDPDSHAAVTAERSLLTALHGGCSAPVGAYADHVPRAGAAAQAGQVHLRAAVFDRDGGAPIRVSGSAGTAQARALGQDLAGELLRRGAGDYISVTEPSDTGDAQ